MKAKREGGSVSLNWIRQTRIDGDSWAGEVPLGETEERYLVQLFDDEALLSEAETAAPHYAGQASHANRALISQYSSVYGWGTAAQVLF